VKVVLRESVINEQTEFVYTFFKPQTEAKGIRFSFKNSLPATEAHVITDKEKVYAILTNLVKNAIKYTPAGSIEFGYEMTFTSPAEKTLHTTSQQAAYLQFYVKDTGIGIPANRIHAIFDRFVQADIADTRAFQGAGLGLSIAKAYVKMLHGEIWVESEEDIGSTFYFSIPYIPAVNGNKVSDELNLPVGILDKIKKLKILIVEDDETSEMLIRILMRNFSDNILVAVTGAEAIELCHKNTDIDLILMDIKMAEMDGYEATRQIRQFNKDIFILAQTAFGLSGDREKAMAAGCNDYISKPIVKEKMMELIEKYFRK